MSSTRAWTVVMLLGTALGGNAWAQAARPGPKSADYYVYFQNGRVMRVLNTIEQGEWTALVIDGKNHLTVPKISILRVERITPEEKSAAASSVNVQSEQPEPAVYPGQPPYHRDLALNPEGEPPSGEPPPPPNPEADKFRSQMRDLREETRSNIQFADGQPASSESAKPQKLPPPPPQR